ncbi:MAG TPA: class I SAM-dependent methyltransferase [Dehalococcoidales bacterium]|nr:class I SAM-dependent methyltransferase [Dehalococcoidales bacterium]
MQTPRNFWNTTYTRQKKVWGDQPSQLAAYTCNTLKESTRFKNHKDLFILDLGCGYGRDSVFLAQNLPCHILGLDSSEKAIEIAREHIPKTLKNRIELLCFDFSRVNDKYDIIFCASLYHVLRPDEREKLRETIQRCLKKEGLLFLSTFSIRDPQHYGKGQTAENEKNAFIDEIYLHFSDRENLEKEFGFLNIQALFERDYRERHDSGEHHHISWLLMGKAE